MVTVPCGPQIVSTLTELLDYGERREEIVPGLQEPSVSRGGEHVEGDTL